LALLENIYQQSLVSKGFAGEALDISTELNIPI